MDDSIRLQYLKAMGIDVWVPRNSGKREKHQGKRINDGLMAIPSIKEQNTGNSDWLNLQNEVRQCQACELSSSRTNIVFGNGNQNAEWMLIGDWPGQQEDEEGLPFVGQAGSLLTEMIRSVGQNRDSVYITNIIKCRPPSNREPKMEEVKSCQNYLFRQIESVNPKIILAVGGVAAQILLDTNKPLSSLRGEKHQFLDIPLVVVYHPDYLLGDLLEKRNAWQDLQLAIKIYKEEK